MSSGHYIEEFYFVRMVQEKGSTFIVCTFLLACFVQVYLLNHHHNLTAATTILHSTKTYQRVIQLPHFFALLVELSTTDF